MAEPQAAPSFSHGSHREIHVVSGCVVTGTDAAGHEVVDRVAVGQSAMFWGHYRVAPDGRQLWIADYDDLKSAMDAARAQAGRRPFYVDVDGELRIIRAGR
jgi:hypothetical protein